MTYLVSLNERTASFNRKLNRIKLVAFDVDGVLTNGQLFYQADGETAKVFSVKDGVGLKLLADSEITVAVISAKESPMVAKRMSDLGVKHYFPGTKDKLLVLTELCSSLSIGLEEAAFVGDDMVDLKPMSACGVSFCPADAFALVKEAADITTVQGGGQGVAREVCDLVLAAQGKFEAAYQLTTEANFERKR